MCLPPPGVFQCRAVAQQKMNSDAAASEQDGKEGGEDWGDVRPTEAIDTQKPTPTS